MKIPLINIIRVNPIAMLLMVVVILVSYQVSAERIKDIASVSGVRSNQLVGYGLVVGLDGSGDQTSQTPFTVQSLKSMLSQFGVSIPDNINPQVKNIAAVSIHAELPPFAKPGQTIDVTVSSLGNAKSLRGGTLLLAPLKGADGVVYAVAQGSLLVGGLSGSGNDGSRVSINIPSVGRIPSGAIVETPSPTRFDSNRSLVLNLNKSDFTTAKRVSDAINSAVGSGTAWPLDGASVFVTAPEAVDQRVSYLSFIENLTLIPGEAAARVIVNSRTGTVVIGRNVRVSSAAVAHGNLSVTIKERPSVSQPAGPLSGASTVVVPTTDVLLTEEASRMFLFDPGVELNDIVRAVNQVGAAPSDLVAILEALKDAGALRAELVII